METTIEIIQTLLLLAVLYIITKKGLPAFVGNTSNKNSVVLDTSALIDGRIVEVAKAGFIPGKLIVPRFVVQELQLLADGRDAHKRERARFGLDMIALLQTELPGKVSISKKDYADLNGADDKLVRLSAELGAILCTSDYNLNKVAIVSGVEVLNINELAQAVRPPALPGEKHTVKIVQKGSNRDQGVGYLEDGTMVVVSGAGNLIGRKIDISVTRMLQTEAGKMIFAKKSSAQADRK